MAAESESLSCKLNIFGQFTFTGNVNCQHDIDIRRTYFSCNISHKIPWLLVVSFKERSLNLI